MSNGTYPHKKPHLKNTTVNFYNHFTAFKTFLFPQAFATTGSLLCLRKHSKLFVRRPLTAVRGIANTATNIFMLKLVLKKLFGKWMK